MKIYKFKDLSDKSNLDHLFQIIDENKIWCAAPDTLNDIQEFAFEMDYRPTDKTGMLLAKVIEIFGSAKFPPSMSASYVILNNKLQEFTAPHVSDIIEKCRSTIGITSFSLTRSNHELWERYGGKGNGVAVEFDIPPDSIGKTFHLVDYVDERIFHVDTFLDSQISSPEEIFRKILCTKTKEWQAEREIRFLGRTPDINVTFEAPVFSITIGNTVSESLISDLELRCKKRNIHVHFQ